MTQGQCHHDRHRQTDSYLHLRLATDVVMLKAKALIDTAVNPFQRTAPIVTTLPGRTAIWGRRKNTPILLLDINAHDTTIIARFRPRLPVARFPVGTLKPISGCRTAILQCVTRHLKTLESHRPLLFGLWTMTKYLPFFTVHDIVSTVWIEWPGSDDLGVVVRVLFLFPPTFNDIHQRPDVVLIPQTLFQGGTIQTTVCREVLTTLPQFWRLAKQGFQLHPNSLLSERDAGWMLNATGISYSASAIRCRL